MTTPGALNDNPSASIPGATTVGEESSFESAELAIVLSRYDIGVINSIHRFRRGSALSPKVLVRASRGDFILKRRAPDRGDTRRVAFAHRVQMHLGDRRFPLPRLVRSRPDGQTLVVLEPGVAGGAAPPAPRLYEMFEFIAGERYDQSLATTDSAGRALAALHLALADFNHTEEAPAGTYHNADGVRANLGVAATRLEPGERELIARLRDLYEDAALRAEERGIASWPIQVVHGDWHPGNMLFRQGAVAAVIDYDTVRVAPRIIDLANGALQFSLMRGPDDPASWPPSPDEARFKRFCRGYDSVQGCIISTAELNAMPWLMIQALIAEASGPVATTGRFGGMDGGAFLRMVVAKSGWIAENAGHLAAMPA